MLASEIYALAVGTVCLGDEECHWCTARCKRHWLHDEPPRPQYVKPILPLASKRPGNPYICAGCWHFRRKSITVRFMNGRIKDRRTPCDHTWFITDDDCVSVDRTDKDDRFLLYKTLLTPPTSFCLMIRRESPVMLQYGVVNEFREVRANTRLKFTLDNIVHEYTVYDLEQTLKHPEIDGNEPGVQALLKEFGRPADFVEKETDKKQRGGQYKKQEESASYVNRVVSAKAQPILRSA